MPLVDLFLLFLLSYYSPVGVNKILTDVMRRFGSIVRASVTVPADDVHQLGSLFHVRDDVVDILRTLLRFVSINRVLC